MSVKIAPSILSADFARLADAVAEAEEGGADWIHVDVMDGHFVPNITLGPAITEAVRRATSLPVDVHLMIHEPDRHVEAFVDAGADWLTVHQEVTPHLHRTLARIRELGARPGVVLNPATPVETLSEVVADVDMVLLMSVNPGFGGQSFIPGSVEKVARLGALLDDAGAADTEIEVDGGISPETAGPVAAAGATVLVAGSAVYRAPEGVERAIAAIREAAERGGDGGA